MDLPMRFDPSLEDDCGGDSVASRLAMLTADRRFHPLVGLEARQPLVLKINRQSQMRSQPSREFPRRAGDRPFASIHAERQPNDDPPDLAIGNTAFDLSQIEEDRAALDGAQWIGTFLSRIADGETDSFFSEINSNNSHLVTRHNTIERH